MKSLAHLLPRRHLHFLGAHNSRKIKNKIGFRFFASFERVSNSGSLGCVGLCESVQFSVRRNQTYREMIIFLLAAEAGDLRYGKPIRCSFYSSKDQAKSRGEFRRRWASIQPDILLTGLLFVSLQKQNLFI